MLAQAGDTAASIKAFSQLMEEEDSLYSLQARANVALLQLKRGNLLAFQKTADDINDEELRMGLLLEKGMDLLSKGQVGERRVACYSQGGATAPVGGFGAIDVSQRFAGVQPVEPKLAQKQLNALKKLSLTKSQQEALAEIELRSLIFNQKWDLLIERYEQQKAKSEVVSDSMLISLGEAYYRNGEFNKARKQLNKVIFERKGSPYTEYAYFFSALAANKEGTPQSKTEALELFQKVIDLKAVFAVEATMQKARLLVDLEHLDKAQELLQKLFKENCQRSPRLFFKHFWQKCIIGKALREKSKELLLAAEQLYMEVLKTKGMKDAFKHQVHYLLGQTQEEKLDTSLAKALDSYFKVVNLEVQQQKDHPVEWEYYYKCGLRAVDLLEKENRWGAAANLLEKWQGILDPSRTPCASERMRFVLSTISGDVSSWGSTSRPTV